MTKKEVLRKVCKILYYLYFLSITIIFFLGKVDTSSIILMYMMYGTLVLNIILGIISKIALYNLYKSYKDGLEYLKAIHKKRYKLYFNGSKQKIEEYSAEIERYGTYLINSVESVISKNLFNKKYSQKLEEIIEQCKTLMITIK